MKTKLEDVAKEAGVSLATVSRVLNNHPVKDNTRKKVQQAIDLLGYRPNLAARSLTQNRTQTIGIVVSSLMNPYHTTLLHSLEATLRAVGYLSIICSSEDDPTIEAEIINGLLDSQVDGIIVAEATPLNANNGFYAEVNQSVPLVLINGNPNVNQISQVMVDQQKGMRSALEYLLSLGHTKICMLRGRFSPSYDIKEQTFRQIMGSRSLEISSSSILNVKEANQIQGIAESEKALGTILVNKKDRPTAIFASNELLAAGALQAIKAAGLKIPEDISLVVQDNTFISTITTPMLTTLDMKMFFVGKASAEMMLQLIKAKSKEPRCLIFFPELIIRDSTGPVRKECNTANI